MSRGYGTTHRAILDCLANRPDPTIDMYWLVDETGLIRQSLHRAMKLLIKDGLVEQRMENSNGRGAVAEKVKCCTYLLVSRVEEQAEIDKQWQAEQDAIDKQAADLGLDPITYRVRKFMDSFS